MRVGFLLITDSTYMYTMDFLLSHSTFELPLTMNRLRLVSLGLDYKKNRGSVVSRPYKDWSEWTEVN